MVAGIILIVAGGLVVLSGVLGAVGRLPRNRFAGVRTGATMRSEEAFRVGNRAAGPAIILGGVVAVAAGVVALFVPSGEVNACVLIGALLMGALGLVGAFQGQRAADRAG